MSKQPEIKACANKTFGQYIMAIQSASSNFSLLSLLDVDLEKCMWVVIIILEPSVDHLKRTYSNILEIIQITVWLTPKSYCFFNRGIENFRRCVVPVLKTCDDPPSSVSVDSVFNHLRKITPCDELFSEQEALLPAAPQASVFGLDLPWLVGNNAEYVVRANSPPHLDFFSSIVDFSCFSTRFETLLWFFWGIFRPTLFEWWIFFGKNRLTM